MGIYMKIQLKFYNKNRLKKTKTVILYSIMMETDLSFNMNKKCL